MRLGWMSRRAGRRSSAHSIALPRLAVAAFIAAIRHGSSTSHGSSAGRVESLTSCELTGALHGNGPCGASPDKAMYYASPSRFNQLTHATRLGAVRIDAPGVTGGWAGAGWLGCCQASVRIARSLFRELTSSLVNTLCRCHSTVRGLRKSSAPIWEFVFPSPASRAIWASCAVRI